MVFHYHLVVKLLLIVVLNYMNKVIFKNIKILGSSLQTVMDAEDRERFKNILEEIGEYTAPSKVVSNKEEAIEFSKEIGFPLLIRSSFALGGLGSGFAE